jgi:hypothetical protein
MTKSYEYAQQAAYIFGYGPVWEAFYVHNIPIAPKTVNIKRTSSKLGQEHFKELGFAIRTALKTECSYSNAQLGRYYHDHFMTIVKPPTTISSPDCQLVDSVLSRTNTKHIYDGISLHTKYFKQSCCLKNYVLSQLARNQHNTCAMQ